MHKLEEKQTIMHDLPTCTTNHIINEVMKAPEQHGLGTGAREHRVHN